LWLVLICAWSVSLSFSIAQNGASEANSNFIDQVKGKTQRLLFIDQSTGEGESLGAVRSVGYDNHKSYYCYVTNHESAENLTLVLDNHLVDDCTLTVTHEDGSQGHLRLSSELAAAKNYISFRLNPHETVLLQLHVINRPDFNIPCLIHDSEEFQQLLLSRSFINGLFFGAFFLFFIYALISLIVSGKKIYFWLALYIVFSNIFHLREQGIELPFAIGEKSLFFSVLVGLLALTQIGHHLLPVRRLTLSFDYAHKFLSLIYIIMIILVLTGLYDFNLAVFIVFFKALSVLGICAYFYVLIRACYYATSPGFYKILLISYVSLVIGFVIKPLSFIGVIEYGNGLRYSAMIGQFTELLCLSGYLILQGYSKIKAALQADQEIKELEKSALRAQMNPHFIFNCLNSIQNFIMDNKKDKAMDYLSRFAKLIRQNLNASVKAQVSIAEEVSMLHSYLELEQMRFKNKFAYIIKVDPNIDQSTVFISPLLIQPFVENAILHGIADMKDKCLVKVSMQQNGSYIHVCVEDNGTGIQLEETQAKKDSLGMNITERRLNYINDKIGKNYSISTSDEKKGTQVLIRIRILQENIPKGN